MLRRFAQEFRGKPLNEGFIDAFAKGFQDMEDGFYSMLINMAVNTATGNQLNLLGDIVGQSRGGRNDNEYRLWIYIKIAINIGKGTPEEVIEIFRLVTGSTVVALYEYFPGVVELYGNVNFEYGYLNNGPEAFAFEGGVDGLGFGDLFDPDIGGIFAEIVINDVTGYYRLFDSILAGGVRLGALGWFSDNPFGFEGDPAARGFGDVNDVTIGGEFATIVPI